MSKNDNPPEPSYPDTFLKQLAYAHMSAAAGDPLTSDSPPETMLAAALHFLLADEIEQGRIQIIRRERITLPTRPALGAEVDLLLHQSATGARGGIEILSRTWHRRTPEEFAEEIRRERLLRRSLPTEFYSAREVQRNPWSVALDVVALLGTVWTDFHPVVLPRSVRSLVTSWTGQIPPPEPSDHAPVPQQPPLAPLSTLEHVRQVVRALPPAEPSSDPMTRAMRRDYPRAFMPWAPEEHRALENAYRVWIDVDDIAAALQRSPRAVWKRLNRLGLVEEKSGAPSRKSAPPNGRGGSGGAAPAPRGTMPPDRSSGGFR